MAKFTQPFGKPEETKRVVKGEETAPKKDDKAKEEVVAEAVPTTAAPMDTRVSVDGFDTGVDKK